MICHLTTLTTVVMPDATSEEASDLFRTFSSTLSGDEVSSIAKTDPLIKAVASKELKKHGYNKERFAQIRNKVRELARLLIALRKLSKDENSKLENYLTPESFSLVIIATKQAAGYDEEKFLFQTPSLATKLGNFLKTCAHILEAQAVETKDEVLLTAVNA
jgi:preprotein translocase subunit Sss1